MVAISKQPLIPGTQAFNTRGQTGAHGKPRAPSGEHRIRMWLIRVCSPEEHVLQGGSADCLPQMGLRAELNRQVCSEYLLSLVPILSYEHEAHIHASLSGPIKSPGGIFLFKGATITWQNQMLPEGMHTPCKLQRIPTNSVARNVTAQWKLHTKRGIIPKGPPRPR